MDYFQKKILEALLSIQAFLDKHGDLLGEVNAGGARTALNDIVQKIDLLADRQDPTRFRRRRELEAERSIREELRETYMRPIARIAQFRLRDTPEFDDLRMPHRSVDTATLLRWARQMAQAAELYTPMFVSHGLEPDFIARLLAAVDVAQKVRVTRSDIRATAVGATGGLREETARAVGVLGVIDALVARKLKDATLKREWKFMKKVARRAAKAVEDSTAPGITEQATPPSPASPPGAPVTDATAPVTPLAEPPAEAAA
jgi:hypothetical protein